MSELQSIPMIAYLGLAAVCCILVVVFLARLAVKNNVPFWIGGEAPNKKLKFGIQIGIRTSEND